MPENANGWKPEHGPQFTISDAPNKVVDNGAIVTIDWNRLDAKINFFYAEDAYAHGVALLRDLRATQPNQNHDLLLSPTANARLMASRFKPAPG